MPTPRKPGHRREHGLRQENLARQVANEHRCGVEPVQQNPTGPGFRMQPQTRDRLDKKPAPGKSWWIYLTGAGKGSHTGSGVQGGDR